MNITRPTNRSVLLVLCAAVVNLLPLLAIGQGTTLTYQGRLNNNGSPAAGIYDLRFTIYDSTNNPGVVIAGPITNTATGVSNGLFSVALDFGDGVFTGPARWLEIAVRTNGGGAFTTLSPRQPLTPVPYAVFANSASNLVGALSSAAVSGTYGNAVNFNNGANNFDGTFTGQFFGSTFTGGLFTGAFLGSGSGLGDVWHTTGNLGTTPGVSFLGTADSQPLDMRVNNQRALRLEASTDVNAGNAPNVIGGHVDNSVAPGIGGAVIGGGGGNGLANSVASTEDVIAGGYLNRIEAGNAHASAIGGGFDNAIEFAAPRAVIAGGHANRIGTNSQGSAVGGGEGNMIGTNAVEATIAGGSGNAIADNSGWAAVGGGTGNRAAYLGTIGGGVYNGIGDGSPGGTIGGGWGNFIQTNVSYSTVGGGFSNSVSTSYTFAGGGFGNTVQPLARYSVLGGGETNVILTGADHSVIGGGGGNTNGASYATVPGGFRNYAAGQYSFAAGRQSKAMHNGAFVWADSTAADFNSTAPDQFLVRASGGLYLYNGAAGVNVDQADANNGDIGYALRFGVGSGEGIGSKRTAGGNQFGLDFYTLFTPRMSITQLGNVGIGTGSPSATLHVVGNSPTSMALRIANGGISVAGAGVSTPTPAFIHLANATNILAGYVTLIDNPLCNNDPNAILIVTPNWVAGGGVYNNHVVGVSYIPPQWCIFNEDFGAMPTNAAFNVLVIKP